MTTPIHLLGFSGSLRKGSYNSALLRAAEAILPANTKLEIFDISGMPIFNQDTENAAPKIVKEFSERINAADGLLIATPEYNASIPGGLKNALDWASRSPNPLNGKPGAIMGASTGLFGTIRAQQHLRQILLHGNMLLVNKPEVYISQAQNKFNQNGYLIDNASRGFLKELLEALIDLINHLQQHQAQ